MIHTPCNADRSPAGRLVRFLRPLRISAIDRRVIFWYNGIYDTALYKRLTGTDIKEKGYAYS